MKLSRRKVGTFKAVALIALLGGTPAFSKTYDIAEIGNYFSIAGSIVTDGNFGTLQQADILSWNLTITDSAHNSLNMTGPSFTSEHTGQVFVTGSDLYADMFGLYFTFNDVSGPGQVDFYDHTYQITPVGPVQTTADVKLSDAFIVGGPNAPWPYFGELSVIAQGGVGGGVVSNAGEQVQFAIDPTPFTDNATPLPGAVWLFASGLAGLGLFGRRRKKKAALAA